MTDETDDFYDDPIDALAELFAVADPEPDPRFADRLESDLRVAHAERNLARRPSRIGSRVTALATLALVILVAATVSLVWRDRSVSSALEMSNADGVVVTLPDGSTVDDPADGFDLPEGTVIVVRIGGSVTIDDVSLHDGVVVTVRDGSLVTDAPITTTTVQAVDDVAPTDAPAPPPPNSDRPAPTTPNSDRPAPTTPTPDRPAPPPPISDRASPATPTPVKPEPPVVAVPGPGLGQALPDTSPSTGVELALAIKVDGKSGRVVVRWSTGRALEPTWRALVVRSTGEVEPAWPLDSTSVLLGESHGAGRSELIDEPGPDARFANYRVVVVDRAGGVVARSAVQSVKLR